MPFKVLQSEGHQVLEDVGVMVAVVGKWFAVSASTHCTSMLLWLFVLSSALRLTRP